MENRLNRRDVIAGIVLALLFLGVLLPGCYRARYDGGARADSANKLKQLALSLHNYESAYEVIPPLFGGGSRTGSPTENFVIAGGSVKQVNVYGPIHVFLLPWMEYEPLVRTMTVERGKDKVTDPYEPRGEAAGYKQAVKPYWSPSDPSHAAGKHGSTGAGVTSYAANAQLFAKTDKRGMIEGELTGNSAQYDRGIAIMAIKDGASNVIAFAEKYGQCGNGGSLWSANINGSGPPVKSAPVNSKSDPYFWPVFALGGDKGTPPAKYALDPKQGESAIFFQSQPASFTDPDKCDAMRASTPYGSGILVGMGDGSVRNVTKSIKPEVWFLALYPEDGAKVDLD